MKKIFFGLAIVFAAISANAEYLYWSVGDTVSMNGQTYTAGTDFTGVALYKSYGNDDSFITSYTKVPGTYQTDIGPTGNGYSYYIELLSYGEDYTSTSVAKGESFTYAELQNAMYSGVFDAPAMTAVWTGTAVVTTPETTSGLLLLMGFAMLGLKRKKEV